MTDNIVVGALQTSDITSPTRYRIPLSFVDGTVQSGVNLSISTSSMILFFNSNNLSNDSLYLSAYTLNKSTIYFAGFQCVFGNYINLVDNGCPYKFYFLDESNGQNYSRNSYPITFKALNNGVNLYAELR